MKRSALEILYNEGQLSKIRASKLLLVGCGGVGCELIKNIIKLGFKDIFLVDNDYVDISNLNRQFYFTKQTINKSKSLAIKELLKLEDQTIKVEAEYVDIQSEKFDSCFYKQFDMVLCALDNQEAKEHLTYMCIRYNLPMVIVGAEGFNGQVKIVIRGKTECCFCYKDDNFKPEEAENIPVCNLKGVPSNSNDCIIWAKFFLDDLFLSKKYIIEGRKYMKNKDEVYKYWEEIFNETFHYEESPKIKNHDKINHLTFETAIKKEEPLQYPQEHIEVLSSFEKLQSISAYANVFVNSLEYFFLFQSDPENSKFLENDYKKNSLYSCNDNFVSFLAACTNLRIYIYKNIEPKLIYQHEYQVKNVVGKIVPSIASTNSVIGAMQILEAMNLLMFNDDLANYDTKIKWFGKSKNYLISQTGPILANPECRTCSMRILYFEFYLDFEKHCLFDLIAELKRYKDFGVAQINYDHYCIYDSENEMMQVENHKNLEKKIIDLLKGLYSNTNKAAQEISFRISNNNKKIFFEWDLVLINKKGTSVCSEEPLIGEKVKKQLYDYCRQRQTKVSAEKFNMFRKCNKNNY